MTVKKRIAAALLLIVLALAAVGEPLLAFAIRASAVETSHSNVLDDLEKDDSFNPDDYPAIAGDYSLQVIQVAEGTNGELFLYVYQPSNDTKDLRAAKINMSLEEPTDKNASYSLYNLTWLNSNGVFDKYLVEGVTVSDAAYRYYTIATIYRAHDESIDDAALDDDDIVNYEGEAVAKAWCCYVYNGFNITDSAAIEVAGVTIHSVGFTKFYTGFELFGGNQWVDAHFVAFSIDDFNVQYIYDAKISFKTQEYYAVGQTADKLSYYYYEDTAKPLELPLSNTGENSTGSADKVGWFGKTYSWNRISTVNEFVTDTENVTNIYLSETDKANLSMAQFVFRFYETERRESNSVMGQNLYGESGTAVSEIALLQISFLANNKVYNLGVVSDIVSDDGAPDYIVDLGDNINNGFEDLSGIMRIILLVVIGIFIYCIIKFFEPIIKLIWSGIKFLFYILVVWPLTVALPWVITTPFRFIGWLLKGG